MNDFKMGYSPPKLLNGTGSPIAYDPGRSWASAEMRELFLLFVGYVLTNETKIFFCLYRVLFYPDEFDGSSNVDFLLLWILFIRP